MKILASLVILGLIGFVSPVFAESPIVSPYTGDMYSAILQTPEFKIDTSEFGSTGEIIIDVIFENPTTKKYGINWVYETSTPDYTPDPVEFYEKYKTQRMFYISIKDITSEENQKLHENQFIVITKDPFIATQYNEKSTDFEVEVLDIDSLIEKQGIGQKIETTLRLSSPELIAEHDYEVILWTSSRTIDPLTFTLPVIQERVVNTPTPFKGIQTEEPVKEIPNWVKDIFDFYASGSIGDSELIGALQYLIKEGIIKV